MRQTIFPAAILTIGLAACGSPDLAEDPADDTVMQDQTQEENMRAMATLMTPEGQEVGTALAMQSGDDVTIAVEATNLPPGTHGVHVHETGSCSPDFSAAGGHWNPTGQSHGLEDPEGQHAGDMPNLEVAEDGSASLQYTLEGGATWDGLMDADGSALIVHSGEDDQTTDPSGDSGDRIACGVFQEGGTAPAPTA